MKNVLLLLTAIILAIICFPIGLAVAMFYPSRTLYLLKIAIGIDQLGNVVCSRLFNNLLITSKGYKFGFEDETISSVIGKNQLSKTLTPLGKGLDKTLNWAQRNHAVKSIEIFLRRHKSV